MEARARAIDFRPTENLDPASARCAWGKRKIIKSLHPFSEAEHESLNPFFPTGLNLKNHSP